MCKVYGYARISTPKQNIERQERNIKAAYADAVIISEAYTGTKTDGREKFNKLIAKVKAGDTIVFDSVSRMSRNAEEGFKLYKELYEQGVELVFIKEPHINTATYKQAAEKQIATVRTGDKDADKLLNTIMGALNDYMMSLAERQIHLAFEQAEKEVQDLHQRTKEGIETARLAGKQIGQQAGRKLNVKKAAAAKEIIKKHAKEFGGSLNDAECMKQAGLARNTYYKYKRELREQRQREQQEQQEQ